MKNLLRGVSIGILVAVGTLSIILYIDPSQTVVKTQTPEKVMTIEKATAFLEKHSYVVQKKDGSANKPSETKKEDTKEDKKGTNVEAKESPKEEIKHYQLVVIKGMKSKEVASLLYKNGIIDDVTAFEQFMEDKGYHTMIGIGTYKLNEQMTYDQIGQLLTD